MVNTSDSGSRGRGFEPHSGRRVVSLSKTYLPPKVLVIPRKRWLRPNMTEKLFTGTLNIKPKHMYLRVQITCIEILSGTYKKIINSDQIRLAKYGTIIEK